MFVTAETFTVSQKWFIPTDCWSHHTVALTVNLSPDWRRFATLPPLIGLQHRPPPSNHSIAKFFCGREMRRRWLNLDSPVFRNIFTMDLLRRKEGCGGRLLVLAVVFGWCLGSVSCFGQNLDSEFTFLLQAGRSECFFQTAIKNGTMEVEYQVTVCVCALQT